MRSVWEWDSVGDAGMPSPRSVFALRLRVIHETVGRDKAVSHCPTSVQTDTSLNWIRGQSVTECRVTFHLVGQQLFCLL